MSQAEAPPDGIAWVTEWEAALAVARETRRPLLIDVAKDP